MRKKVVFSILLSFILNSSIAQEIIPPSTIKWYTINEAFELAKKEQLHIILDVYTDWCSWCKFMMKTTFANKGIASFINNHFYAAKFNAEALDTIEFQGKQYFNRKIGRRPTHDLAAKLLDGKLSYPSIVFFDRQGKKTVVPGYKESKDIEPFLVYFAENLGNTVSLNDFVINFMYSFPGAFKKDHSIFKIDNSLKPDTLGQISWVAPENVQKLVQKKAKPILVYFYTDWCISCKVMERTSFGNRELAKKINKNYYSVKINAAEPKEMKFLGKTYNSSGQNQPNQIAQKFLNQNFLMPALVIFDEKQNVISRINGYLIKEQLIPLTEYFYNKDYKKLSFKEYLKVYMTERKQKKEEMVN